VNEGENKTLRTCQEGQGLPVQEGTATSKALHALEGLNPPPRHRTLG